MSSSDLITHHGLRYPPGFLDNLPVLQPRPDPHSPIRILSAHDFAFIHHSHLTAHAPDNVLFPFLHGIEGSNEAQNLFFAYWTANGGKAKPVQIPSYRGLIWVVCDDDLDPDVTLPGARSGVSEGDDEDLDDDFSDGSSSYVVDPEHFAMDVDPDRDSEVHVHRQSESGFASSNSPAGDLKNTDSHMHPIVHRVVNVPAKGPLLSQVPTNDTSTADQHVPLERRDSTASSTFSTSTDADSSSTQFSPTSSTISSPPTSLASSLPPDKFTPPHNARPTTSSPPPSSPPHISSRRPKNPPLMTSTFRARDLLLTDSNGNFEPVFAPLKVPDGISLRNFGIQVPIYATISDIVVYSPKGLTRSSIALARYFKTAVEEQARERRARLRKNSEFLFEAADGPGPDLLTYNVFVLSATVDKLRDAVPYLMVSVAPDDTRPNTVDFAEREKKEMRELTRASEIISVVSSAEPHQPQATATAAGTEGWDPMVGQVFLGNANDVPFTHESLTSSPSSSAYSCSPHLSRKPSAADLHANDDDLSIDPFNFTTNDPLHGRGYDICVECRDYAPFPSSVHFRAAEEHFQMLDAAWEERCRRSSSMGDDGPLPPRPPPNASAVIHLPFPSSPRFSRSGIETLNELFPTVWFLERMLQLPTPSPTAPPPELECNQTTPGVRRWSSVSSLLPSSPTLPLSASCPPATSLHTSPPAVAPRTRPLKVLLYSSDGYTESSVLALCLLMAVRRLSLPEAYLELQVARRRSFFVHQADLSLLRRVEARLAAARTASVGPGPSSGPGPAGRGKGRGVLGWSGFSFQGAGSAGRGQGHPYRRPAANSVSSPHSPLSIPAGLPPARMVVPSQGHLIRSRPRANTSPWLPSLFSDHQTWFNDPRFDGSFPSRVLPFLYLGNLNHASNAYMLHALGITHVVSVGECALIPPPHISSVLGSSAATISHPSFGSGGHFIAGKGPGHEGSLWIEEREGRIKVLDIKGVCDDGIDTLEPQLGHICDWIEHARAEGGQVLVHCRVGVSRSATVTIAYVMKHLGLPLVDAYLIVRSRRLSVLIQPNMRLLYNLCGWEVRLARERAGADEERLKVELAGRLNWPYLAKEVHALNQKYLSFDV